MRIQKVSTGFYAKVLDPTDLAIITRMYKEINDRASAESTINANIATNTSAIAQLNSTFNVVQIQMNDAIDLLTNMFPANTNIALITRPLTLSELLTVQKGMYVQGESQFEDPVLINNTLDVILGATFESGVEFKSTATFDTTVEFKDVPTFDKDAVVSGTLTAHEVDTPNLSVSGAASVLGNTTLADVTVSGQITSTATTGTSPLVVSSQTQVNNLNVEYLQGKQPTDFAPISHVGAGGSAHALATETTAGFMSSDDKVKLDNMGAGGGGGSNQIYMGPAEPATPSSSVLWLDTSE